MTGHRMIGVVERFGLLILLAAVVVFFSFSPETPQFGTSANFTNILGAEAVLGIVAIATVIPLITGHFDLSVGPVAGLSSLLVAGLMAESSAPLAIAMAAGVGSGLVVGAVNGFIVARLGINSIVTTLGTTAIVSGFVLLYSKGQTFSSGISQSLLDFGTGTWLGLPRSFLVLALVALIAWYVLEHTPVGRSLYAAGASPRAAELVGLRVRSMVHTSFIASGAIAGVAGVILVAVQGSANPQIGPGLLLPAITAVFLGATAIRPGHYNVAGTIVAVFFLAFTINGLTHLGVAIWVEDMFNGVALLAAVIIATFSTRVGDRMAAARGRSSAEFSQGADPGGGPADEELENQDSGAGRASST